MPRTLRRDSVSLEDLPNVGQAIARTSAFPNSA